MSTKFKYNFSGATEEILLATYKPPCKRLAICHNNEPYYTPLVDANDETASPLRVTFDGRIYSPGKLNPENLSWSEIADIAHEGLGAAYFDIGDMKTITLNGDIGDHFTATDLSLKVFILHFNYPINGVADNNIIWHGFKNNDGVLVSLNDTYSNKNPPSGTRCFSMFHANDGQYASLNYEGWRGSDFRYDILGATSTPPDNYMKIRTSTIGLGYDATAATLVEPLAKTFLALLPADLRSVMRLWSRWSDCYGGNVKNHNESHIAECVDAVTLLNLFEICTTYSEVNQYEKNHCTQMAYFAAGNSYKHTKYNNIKETNPVTFLISPHQRDSGFITNGGAWSRTGAVNLSTNRSLARPNYACGLAPAFMI